MNRLKREKLRVKLSSSRNDIRLIANVRGSENIAENLIPHAAPNIPHPIDIAIERCLLNSVNELRQK